MSATWVARYPFSENASHAPFNSAFRVRRARSPSGSSRSPSRRVPLIAASAIARSSRAVGACSVAAFIDSLREDVRVLQRPFRLRGKETGPSLKADQSVDRGVGIELGVLELQDLEDLFAEPDVCGPLAVAGRRHLHAVDLDGLEQRSREQPVEQIPAIGVLHGVDGGDDGGHLERPDESLAPAYFEEPAGVDQ